MGKQSIPGTIRAALWGALLALYLPLTACDGSAVPQATPSGHPGRDLLGGLGCMSCHQVLGQGGNLGPELGPGLAAKGAPWIRDYLTSGKHIDVYPGNGHDAFLQIDPSGAAELADYLAGISISTQYPGQPGGSR